MQIDWLKGFWHGFCLGEKQRKLNRYQPANSPPGVHGTLLRRRGAYRPQALKARKLVAIYLYAPRVHAILIEQPRWKAPLTFGVGNAMERDLTKTVARSKETRMLAEIWTGTLEKIILSIDPPFLGAVDV